MDITDPGINDYIKSILPGGDEVLAEMEEYAAANGFPIIGPLVGPFLRQLAKITKAANIFEMGSGYGYSAYWFAGGMSNGGRIICTDGSEENARLGMKYLKRGGFDSMIDYHVGDALEIIKRFEEPFDIILNDINKADYPRAFDLAIPKLRSGGVLITDNVLWSGRVLERNHDIATAAIHEFNTKLFNSKDIISSIIPIRDGLGMAVKI